MKSNFTEAGRELSLTSDGHFFTFIHPHHGAIVVPANFSLFKKLKDAISGRRQLAISIDAQQDWDNLWTVLALDGWKEITFTVTEAKVTWQFHLHQEDDEMTINFPKAA